MALWRKGRSRPARPARGGRRRPRPTGFEALEGRLLLSFAAPVSYSVGTQNSQGVNGFGPHVITADFNGDGKLDLAVSNTAAGTVNILTGNGDGTFRLAVAYGTGAGAGGPVWLAAADFNGDGKLDLAVEGINTVSVLTGNGDGTFAPAKTYAAGSAIRGGLAVADYFGNGRQDIAVVAFGSNNIQILPNNGDGTFGAPVLVPMPSSFRNIRSIVTGNFFGNGRADLAIAGNEGYNNVNNASDPAGVAHFKNDGAGHFTYTGQYAAVTTPDPSGANGQGDTVNPEQVNVADLNGDGKPDLVLSLYDHNIDVFLNQGNGTFAPAVGYTTETPGSVGGYPRGVAFADVNGDGKVDILTDNFGEPVPADQSTPQPGSVGVLYGNGDGTFQAPIQYTPYLLPGGVAVGDFNGDGLPDLAVAQNYTGHAVGVMLNQPNTANQAPTVTGVSPATGPAVGGTPVTIAGTNFTGTTQVDFGGVVALYYVVSNTTIHALAPAGSAGVVDVTVYNAGASATGPADRFTYTSSAQAPAVTGVAPAVGPTYGGAVVTITGTNLSAATAVKFGALFAGSFKVNSSTSITAVAPAESAGVVDVTVLTTSAPSSPTSADHFTYQSPVLTSIALTPASASLADGATQAFLAAAFDQFGKALATPPSFAWSVYGLGSVSSVGLYTAPASGTGTAYVSAGVGSIKAYARVTVNALTTDTWTGLGTTNNWSDPANWSAKAVPGAGTAVVFNATSTKSAVVDPGFAGAVGSMLISSTYGGTVTLGRSLGIAGIFILGTGTYNANGFATSVGGLTTLYIGTYLASTGTQTFAGGLAVSGGTFAGSTGAVTTSSVTLSAGTLNAPSGNFYITGGNFTDSGGKFNADGGTVTYTGTNVSPKLSLGTGSVAFANFTNALTDTYPAGMTITGTLTVSGTFAWKAGAGVISGNIEAQGNVDDENHGGIGNPYLTLDGAANQTIEDLTGGGGGQFRTITINKPAGGTVTLACNPIVFSGLALVAGAVNTGAYSWFIAGPFATAPGTNLGNIEVAGANVTVYGTSAQVANVTFAAHNDKLTAPSGSLSVSGNWNDSVGGIFLANGGTVVFDGTAGAQQITGGGQTFNNLTILAGRTLALESDVIVAGTFTDLGTLIANGFKILK